MTTIGTTRKALVSAFGLIVSFASAQLNWTPLTGMQVDARLGAASFSVGGKGYIGTGDVHGTSCKDLWQYDPVNDSWAQMADYGGAPCTFAVGLAIGSKGYIGIGYPAIDFWEYDPTGNTWTQKANFGGGVRIWAVGFGIGSKGYVGTGSPGFGFSNDLWEYDPSSDQWTQKASMPDAGRQLAVGFAIGSKGYIGTGVSQVNFSSVTLKDFWEYDPVLDTWTQKSDVGPLGRNRAVGWGLGTKGYIACGQNQNGPVNDDLWQYDPSGDTWTQKSNFPGGVRMHASAFCIGGTAYMGMGSLYSSYFYLGANDLWAYDPVNDVWSARAALGRIGRYAGFAFALGGKGYVGAGSTGSQALKDFWEFDPIYGGVWTQKADFPGTPRIWCSGFATGTKGYAGLGLGNISQLNNDLWEYDPGSNSWAPRSPLPAAARYGAVAFSIGNRCFAGLGASTSGPLADLYEYDPVLDQWSARSSFPGTARTHAVGFGMNGRGYVGTGIDAFTRKQDFFEYDPVADSWVQKANYPGTARYAAAGFSIGTKGYIGTGDNGFSNQEFWEYDQGTNTWIQRLTFGAPSDRKDAMAFSIGNYGYITCGRTNGGNVPLQDIWEWNPFDCMGVLGGPTVPGSSCNDNNPNTINDVWSPNCYCYGTPCSDNVVTLTLNTDGNAVQTSWDIVITSTNTVMCSGSGYANNSTIVVSCCLPNGCYDLRVFDSFGDGINPGGHVLRDAANNRIIDNFGNGSTFTSTSFSALGFCVPLGSGTLHPASCDVMTATPTTVLHANPDPAVTALYSISTPTVNANTGYQFWITNPNGGFSRRILFTHAAPGNGWPIATPTAQKASYFRLNAMSSPPTVPLGVLLNVRVRSLLNGTYGVFGPACRLYLPVPPCQLSQLTTTASPVISCGATGLSLTNTIYATSVTGATHYQFEFSKTAYLRKITVPTNSVALSFVTNPLQNNNCYDVRVRVSMDGGLTYCPFGAVCTITIGVAICGNAMALEPGDGILERDAHLSVWPNPNDGALMNLSLTGFDVTLNTVVVDVTDVYGKMVATHVIPVQDGQLNTLMEFEQHLAAGLYMVRLQAGEKVYTERLVVHR